MDMTGGVMDGTLELADADGTLLASADATTGEVDMVYQPDGSEAAGEWSLTYRPASSMGGAADFEVMASSWSTDYHEHALPPVPEMQPSLPAPDWLAWHP